MSRPVHTLLWLTVHLCLCERSLRSWEVTSSSSESDRAPVTEPHHDSFTPEPTHTYSIYHTLKYSEWCSKAVQSDPSPWPASTVLSPLPVSSALTTCCQLYFTQLVLSAAYSLLFPSIGTRAYSCARSRYETRPSPPQGQKSYTDPITPSRGLNQTESTPTGNHLIQSSGKSATQ